jgi:hypothetical protein
MEEFDISMLSPEQLEILLGLSTADERSRLVEQQLAQVGALRQPQPNWKTSAGAVTGGAATLVDNFGDIIERKSLAAKQEEQLAAKERARAEFVRALQGEPEPEVGAASGLASPGVLAALRKPRGGM